MHCYSIGHSVHSLGSFLRLLELHGIDAVVDVRSIPYSKYVSQYNREVLQLCLEQRGLEYRWLGGLLGGHNFQGQADLDKIVAGDRVQSGLAQVAALVGAGRRIVLMCAEKEPIDCHRFIVLTFALKQQGIDVKHILADGSVVTTSWLEAKLAQQMGQGYHQLSLFEAPPSKLELYRSRLGKLQPPRAG